jgi:hypothetical protein
MSALVQLIQRIDSLESQIRVAREELVGIQRSCPHSWSSRYNPVVREAYRDPGDTPGTMGIDFRGPMYVPRQETPRWTRTCSRCFKTEDTSQVDQHVSVTPKFP